MASLTRYISFSRSLAVSTVLGVNCASAATKDTVAGNDVARHGVEHDARLRSERDAAGLAGRQKDRHEDVGEVEDGDQAAARGHDLAGLDELVFDAARDRRAQHRVVERRLDLRDLGFGQLPWPPWRRPTRRAHPGSARRPRDAGRVRRSSSALVPAARCSSSAARRISTSARLCSASRIAMSASARAMVAIARCTEALAAASCASSSAVSSRAMTASLVTKSPSFTRISATRPGASRRCRPAPPRCGRWRSRAPRAGVRPAICWFQKRNPPPPSVSTASKARAAGARITVVRSSCDVLNTAAVHRTLCHVNAVARAGPQGAST